MKPFLNTVPSPMPAALRRTEETYAGIGSGRQDPGVIRTLQGYFANLGGPVQSSQPREQPAEAGRYPTRLTVKKRGRLFPVRVEEIDWVEAAGNYVRLHVGPDRHLLRETMQRLGERLDPAKFVRIHRGAIVNLDRIRELRPHTNGDCFVTLQNGTELVLSRTHRHTFHERFGLR